MKNENKIINHIDVDRSIIVIRGIKVILDVDIANLYQVSTKRLNEQVKRNRHRFPNDFMFQLTDIEKDEVVANCDHLNTLRFSYQNPRAFTEYGIAMLSAILRSERAVAMSIFIVRAFIKLREALLTNHELAHKVSELEHTQEKQGEKIESINRVVVQLVGARGETKEPLGFKEKK